MRKAEDRALEAYPNIEGIGGGLHVVYRKKYREGYHQAEKDLALSWEDIRQIMYHIHNVIIEEDVLGADLCKQVLKRFNEEKGNK